MSNVDRLLNINVFTDDDVEAQNRVTLSRITLRTNMGQFRG